MGDTQQRPHSCEHLEFKAKTVTDIPSLPGMASFFMLCDDNTHVYLMVVGMPREVTVVRSKGDATPSPEHCPLCLFCHGNSIVSTISHTVLATVHIPPGVGIILRNVRHMEPQPLDQLVEVHWGGTSRDPRAHVVGE